MSKMFGLELTAQEAFDLWDAHVLPEHLQDRLSNNIASIQNIGQMPKPVRIEVWEKGKSRNKAHVLIPAILWVQGFDAWSQHFLTSRDQPWRRL